MQASSEPEENDALDMTTIRHLLPVDISGKDLIKALSGTLLFDENGRPVWFELKRYGITIWRGYDPDHKRKEVNGMRRFRRYFEKFERQLKLWRRGKGPHPFSGTAMDPESVRRRLGIDEREK